MESLKDIRIVLAGFNGPQSLELKNKIRNAGGKVDYLVNDRTSYVLTTEREYKQNGTKILGALSKKVPVVKEEWLHVCLSSNHVVDTSGYLLTEETGNLGSGVTDSNEPNSNRRKANIKQVKKGQPSIGGKWRTARVFISSTFRDMHGERDWLTRYVFPELQERCAKLRVHVHPVDLRWGVMEEDTENALEICLTELDSCRPFFIGLLGNRYGWCPKDYVVPEEPRFDWLKSVPSGRSITHLEMDYGVLREPEKARAAFYLRDPDFIQNVPEEYKTDFQTENTIDELHLGNLKDKIRQNLPPELVFDNYPCTWRGVVDDKPMVGDLELFGKHVTELFWKHLQEEFPIQEISQDALAIERSYHDRFIESHSHLFVGRQALLQQIRDFTKDQTGSSGEAGPLVIVGQPGSGKTSLVSFFAHTYAKEMQTNEKVFVLVHFVGAAPGSTSVRLMLSRLVQEIGKYFRFKLEKIPEDFKELQTMFKEFLKKIGTILDKKLVLIIDALNQLDNTNNSHSLDWLPEEVPSNVRLIVSTLAGDVYDVLTRRKKTEITVGALTQKEQEEIIRQTLWLYRKRLDPQQVALLLKKTDASKPLYLIVACEELRVFGVFEKVSKRIEEMAETVPKLFKEVLQRLEGDHDRTLVVKTLALLTCSKGGLLETELLQLLGDFKAKKPLPRSAWSRLYHSLQPYLRPPGESGEGVLDFFHQQLPKAVNRLYLLDEEFERNIHKDLADFFWEQADPGLVGTWKGGSERGLNFVAYHEIKSQQWENLKHNLCNLAFIEAKCSAGMTYDLVADYLQINDIKKNIPPSIFDELSEYQRFVLGRAHVLVNSPELTFSMAYSLPNSSWPAKQAHQRYYQDHLETRPFLKWLNKPQTSNPCMMTLSSHDMVVRCCVVCPEKNSRKILSCSDDKTLKIFDGLTGEELQNLKGHTNSILSCCYSPNGRNIVSGGYDKNVLVWSTETGLVERELKGHRGIITGVAVSPNNKWVASSSRDNTIKIWEGRNCVQTLVGHEKGVLGCAFSSNGKFFASCSEDNSVWIWNTASWQKAHILSQHQKPVNSVSWSRDSQKLVSASEDRKAIIWSAEGKCLTVLRGHKDGITSAVFNSAGTRVLTASHDNLLILWDVLTGGNLASFIGHTGSVFRADFTQDDHLISCSFDRTVKVWELREKNDQVGHEARILSVKFSPDGTKLVTGSRDKSLKIWDVQTGKQKHHLRGHISNVFGVCWSPDGKKICSAGRDNILKIWNSDSGECVTSLSGHTGPVRCCSWRSDGKHILSSSDDKTLMVWNVEDNFKVLGTLVGHNTEVVFCTYSEDGRRAASCSDDKVIKLWDTKKGSFEGTYIKIATLNFHSKPLKSLGFSFDSKYLVSGGDDNILVEWNTRNAKISSTYVGHSDGIRGCGFTPDGTYIVSGATDSTVRLWNRKTKKVDCSFACLSRLCALDATVVKSKHYLACGDGSGVLYILSPEGLEKVSNSPKLEKGEENEEERK